MKSHHHNHHIHNHHKPKQIQKSNKSNKQHKIEKIETIESIEINETKEIKQMQEIQEIEILQPIETKEIKQIQMRKRIDKKRICIIGDTHNCHKKVQLEPCDILICCGDYSQDGNEQDIRKFAQWLSKQPADHILLIPGNHDKHFIEIYPTSKRWITDYCPNVIILQNESYTLFGITFYGFFNKSKTLSKKEITMLNNTVP